MASIKKLYKLNELWPFAKKAGAPSAAKPSALGSAAGGKINWKPSSVPNKFSSSGPDFQTMEGDDYMVVPTDDRHHGAGGSGPGSAIQWAAFKKDFNGKMTQLGVPVASKEDAMSNAEADRGQRK